MSGPSNRPAVQPTNRLLWVDLLKGLAVIWMIEVHATNALVRPALRAGTAFDWLNYGNGLIAPAFLFTSGALFLVTLKRKLPDFLKVGPLFWKQVYRLLGVVALGYVLHLPRFSLRQMLFSLGPGDVSGFLQSDILQVIGVSLVFMVLLVLLLRNRGRVAVAAGLAGLAVFLLAPSALNSNWSLPSFLSPYITGQPKTMFPFLPWAGFLLFGSVVGYLYDRVKGSPWFVLGITVFGLLLFWGAWNSNRMAQTWFDARHWKNFYLSSPSWYLGKLAPVLPGIGFWWAWERLVVPKGQIGRHSERSEESQPLSRLLALLLNRTSKKILQVLTGVLSLFGRQSLLAYSFHIPIVYGSALGRGLWGIRGESLSWGGVALMWLGVTILTGLVCWAWDAFKSRSPRWSRRTFYLLWGIFLAYFILSP